jgi:hypothetical protein
MIDFLIAQGHDNAAVDRMTLRQLDLYVRKANERLERTKGSRLF